ncbi:hypothetical protein PR048_026462 [Dryococelus australis]|uniref:Phlebovirus glycoprotein G2 fusion domain-containing protein n=1 Tax=Dryococelus australis TaxID=614101 RepID=A0ABQ9GLE2_9NEOP|nr:hypothetical protein PR048_026462 [Dryococelus australis]
MDCYCVLALDDMYVYKNIYYDQNQRQILGPHSETLVVSIRALLSPWKQPIHFQFNVLMKKKNPIQLQITNLAESCGLKAAAIVSDLGRCEYCLFHNPFDCKRRECGCLPTFLTYRSFCATIYIKVYCCPGFSQLTTKDIMKPIINTYTGEVKLVPKVNEQLLTVKGNDTRDVTSA